MKRLKLCQGQDPCCPVAEVTKTGIALRDDFGGSVTLTKGQFGILLKQGKELL